ncbi:MAG: globin domain-containing protein [Phycisphaerales bacterium]
MDRRRRELVQQSYERLAPGLNGLVEHFYRRLFEVAPEARRLFPPDLGKLRSHFAAAVAIIARNAVAIEAMEQPLSDMGARHAGYGARPEHYAVVGKVLLETLELAAGEMWTPALSDAWRDLIAHVSHVMLKGAAKAAAEAAERMAPAAPAAHRPGSTL